MTVHITTVAFQGVEPLPIDVQVQLSAGLPQFTVVGLPDKAVTESRERVRAAFHALGLGLPTKRITVNLAPADLQKEGSHFDVPIALGLLAATGVVEPEEAAQFLALGELGLDGRLAAVAGVLPAAIAANALGKGLICPAACGAEALWAGSERILAPASLGELIEHFRGSAPLARPARPAADEGPPLPDLADVKGQETARRALEIAAAGGHNLLMSGPPGSGKSMLAARLPGILPPLSPIEALEISTIHSVSGLLTGGRLMLRRPYRDPHHSASLPALVGGGLKAKPGEISLAHHGVLFLDELPEFQRATLEALRQPLESGRAVVSRAHGHVTYPARVQLVAAMNPCRCGHAGDPALSCGREPRCVADYQARLSGPLLDRIDLHVEVPAVKPAALAAAPVGEPSRAVAARVAKARAVQAARYAEGAARPRTNAEASPAEMEHYARSEPEAEHLLLQAAERLHLSARGWQRVLKVARTIADLDGATTIARRHVAEALAFRRVGPGA